jgi:biopolymer transport protein TolR
VAIGTGGGGGGGRAGALYSGFRAKRGLSQMGEINITPLVDVVLVLLLVFMVTAPMMSRGIDVSLPVAGLKDPQPEDRITVSINAEGRVYLGDRPIVLDLLEDELRGRMQGVGQRIAYLRADERIAYGRVIEVVDRMKRAGVENIGFVYELPEEKASR